MIRTIFLMGFLPAGLFFTASCENGSIEHMGDTRLVLLQKVPVVETRFDENFKAALELLYPHECHDTVFIQDRIFLERIDLTVPFKREFIIPPSLMRDFFGSNNPDKKRALREDLFYLSDTSFEKKPDKQFITDSLISTTEPAKLIGDYLARNRSNSLVYLMSNDTNCNNYEIGGAAKSVYHDAAKLNCRIVTDLRKKSREELLRTTVIVVIIPPEILETEPGLEQVASAADNRHKLVRGAVEPAGPKGYHKTTGSACPPDSAIAKINRQRLAIIQEFRNLLHYIATTSKDKALKDSFREDAWKEIHKIPQVRIEGIPGNDLSGFLKSDFTRNVVVSPINDRCQVIEGIRITGW
ncbi:MAG: hypothetical protein NTW16_18755 [Bacteroidetes bacterium]|nr:hypothetical protein [Bacteroidota bacterium]